MQYPSLKKWRFLAVSVAALFVIYTLLDIIVSSNTPCYLMNSGDWLPSAEDPSFAPAERSIFFHETSCAGTLRPRQACAVEAAARAHPQRQVYVLFTAPVTYYTLRTSCLAHLTRLTNVRFARVHVAQYSEGTPAQTILLEALKQSSFPTEHSSDILRIVTLRKWGGIYLDTDMIVTRSLENLPHTFLAKENADNIATGILSIGKDFIGSNLTDIIMKYMRKYFNPEKWSAIGGSLVDYVIEDMCPKLSYSYDYYENPISYCKGVAIFNIELFYPVYFTEKHKLFDPPDSEFDMERPYTYHMWNYITLNETIHRGSVYELIAKRYCPTIYNTYGEEFGVS